jgi:molybdate/tungstate transport system substrate-binding protein
VALAAAIKAGHLRGDVFLSADAEVNQLLLGPDNGKWISWFVVFACNAVVLAYSPKSQFRSDFERAQSGAIPWYQVLLQPGIKLSRNDPNLDPMGYYTVLVCALAEAHYRLPDLKARLLGSDTNPAQINEANLARLDRGEIDALFLYQSGALERGLPHLLLPDEINLSNPAMEQTYARVHFTTQAGQTFRGKPISFTAAVLRNTRQPQAALQVVEYLLSSSGQQLVQSAHFLSGTALVGGDATSLPDHLGPLLRGRYEYLG